MLSKEVEVILTRHLASCLAMPLFIVDPVGNLAFYNESAEALLGKRFEETGELSAQEWATMFNPTNQDGTAVKTEELPLMIALEKRQPAYRDFWIRGLDGMSRHIGVTAFPLIAQGDRFLGGVAIFWELKTYES